MDPLGNKPSSEMDDNWQFSLTAPEDFVNRKVLEIWLEGDGKIQKQWVDIRPIPQEDQWFENVWRGFRDGIIIT
jgi:hypothetical protein